MKVSIYFLIVYFLVSFSLHSHATLTIISNNPDPFEKSAEVAQINTILNCLITDVDKMNGVKVTIDGTGKVTVMGNPTGIVGMKLKQIVTDANNSVELHIESSNVNAKVLFGSWRRGKPTGKKAPSMVGDGKHSIDLKDLKLLHSYKNANVNPCVSSREAVFFHELVEAYEGVKSGLKYLAAHKKGEDAEGDVISELHGASNKKRVGGFTQVNGNDLCFWFYYKDVTNQNAKTSGLKVTLDKKTKETKKTETYKCVKKTKKVSFNGCNNNGFCVLDVPENSNPVYSNIPGTSEFAPTYFSKGPDDKFIVSDLSSVSAYLMDNSGDISSTFSHGSMSSPAGSTYNSITCEVYIGDDVEEKIFVFDVDGTYLRTLTNAAISLPAALDLDTDENLIISNHGADNIIVIDDMTGVLVNTISSPNLETPAGIAYDNFSDQLYVVDNNRERVVLFDYTSGSYQGIFASGIQLQSPWGMDLIGGKIDDIAAGISGNVVTEIAIASQGNQSIITYDTTGMMIDSLSQIGLNVFDLVIWEFPDSVGSACLVSLVLSDTLLMTSNVVVQSALFTQDTVVVGPNQNVVFIAGTSVELEKNFEVSGINASFEIKIEGTVCPDP